MPLGVRALRAYLGACALRERREMYLGDLIWLAATKHTSLDDVQPYSVYCADLEHPHAQDAESAEAVYARVMTLLREGGS